MHLVAVLALVAAADPPAEVRQKIANPGYFDIAACGPHHPDLPPHAGKQALQGAMQSGRAAILECLTDPKARGPAQVSKLSLDATLGEKGPLLKVTGENVTPAGLECAQKAADAYLAQFPGLNAAAGEKDAAAHVELLHTAGQQPAAQLGVNEASDLVARIRLALPGWCDCFTDAMTTAPYGQLKGQLDLTKPDKAGEVLPTTVAFDATGNPLGDKIANCLKGKIAATKQPAPALEKLSVPFYVRLVNSNLAAKLPGATPDLQMTEYNVALIGPTTQLFIDGATRDASKKHYAEVATAYNARGTKLKIGDVIKACDEVVQGDARLLDDGKVELAIFTDAHAMAAEQKAKDPNWAGAEQSTGRNLEITAAQIANFQKLNDEDVAICKKLSAPEPAKSPARKKGKK